MSSEESKEVIGDIVRNAFDGLTDMEKENESLTDANQEKLAEILQNDENFNCPEFAEKSDQTALLQDDMPDPTHSFLNKVRNEFLTRITVNFSVITKSKTMLPQNLPIRSETTKHLTTKR